MSKIVLVDGDLVTYPCAAASNNDPLEIAEVRCDEQIRRILYVTGSTDYAIYLRGERNFRYNIYPEYKANRIKEKPIWLEPCREYLVRTWKATIVDGIETDDRLGIEQTRYQLDSVIASFDKDMLQIPGYHYNFKKDIHHFISPFDGLRNFYKQLLAGDGADNIPSFDGKFRNSTPKFIQKMQEPLNEMTEEWDMHEYVMSYYENLEHYKRNAQLLYILREENSFWQEPKKENQNTNQT